MKVKQRKARKNPGSTGMLTERRARLQAPFAGAEVCMLTGGWVVRCRNGSDEIGNAAHSLNGAERLNGILAAHRDEFLEQVIQSHRTEPLAFPRARH